MEWNKWIFRPLAIFVPFMGLIYILMLWNYGNIYDMCVHNNILPGCSEIIQTCGVDRFKCNYGPCINNIKVCDGKRDCADGSDEVSAICGSLPCIGTAFRCDYGACIDGDLRCNEEVNCADMSDENSCGALSPTSTTQLTMETTRPTTPPLISTRPIVAPGTNTCRAPPQPQNGHWKLHESQCPGEQECNVQEGTELILGSHLIYSCNSGYKIRGPTDVSCSFEEKWLTIPVCIEIRCKALTSASIEARCSTYDDEWISCESPVPPETKATLQCQNSYQPIETNLLSGQRKNVRCNTNGEWEPEPMRCVP
ncbi:PREDICTED: prolow-density lipoprotein receptor-related protein 1-like, partial [Wasmannia auropunctata]|uniref:prolow-density lipoprotein receptor-related protein 1-like n=1 Tax=Wasmannia auropunctata TaxID=64793 RepID=UPI0005EDFAE3